VGFSSRNSSKSSVGFSSIGGSVGSSDRFPTVLKTMWVSSERFFDRFQVGGEREERLQGFRACRL